MSSVFIKPSNTITFDLHIAPSKDGTEVFANSNLDTLKTVQKADLTKMETHQITFRYPRYRDNVDLLSQSARMSGDDVAFDAVAIQYQRMNLLLSSWTFKDGDQVVEVSRENIDALHPNVAAAIIEKINSILAL